MSDFLVKLYDLPKWTPSSDAVIRRPIGPEMGYVVEWVRSNFSSGWASECATSFANHPVSTFIAIKPAFKSQLVGFCSYNATAKGFLGPIGVSVLQWNRGIGRDLLLSCLYAMRAESYGYAIIGAVGPVEFFVKNCGAVEIPGSDPGIYRDMVTG